MSLDFFTRTGGLVPPDKIGTIEKRTGVFAACIANDCLLVTHQIGSQQPELPGGGVDEGESLFQALLREIYEEAGIQMNLESISPAMTQNVGFYADDSSRFYDYTQNFFKFDGDLMNKYFFDGERDAPEHERVSLRPLGDIAQNDFQFFHKKALRQMGVI